MHMTKALRNFESNPQNPKKVQIPFTILMAMDMLLQEIEPGRLSDDGQNIYNIVRTALDEKKNRVRNRQAYTAIIHAQDEDDKQAAFINYCATKGFFT